MGGRGGEWGEDRAYGAGKLTPFLAYPRSLFNCILLSNFPRGAIDRDTRKGGSFASYLRQPSSSTLLGLSISFALFLPISLVRQTRSFASLRPPHPTYPHQPLFPESVGCTTTLAGPPTLRGLFKTARSGVRKPMSYPKGRCFFFSFSFFLTLFHPFSIKIYILEIPSPVVDIIRNLESSNFVLVDITE